MNPGFQIIIEGQSGAGKTPFIAALKSELENRGHSVQVCAPFALANDLIRITRPDCPLGIYNLWHENEESVFYAKNLLTNYITEHTERCQNEGAIALFDRGWLTIVMGLLESVLPDNVKQSEIQNICKNPPATFFLDTMPEITQQRNTWRPYIPWTNENIHSDFEIRRYFIEQCPNLLDRHLVSEIRIDLHSLAFKWSETIELAMSTSNNQMSR